MKTIQLYRLMMSAAVLFFALCLSVEYVDARGGGRGGFGGGRGGISGGRGGFGGGSVRQSSGFGSSPSRGSNYVRQPARNPGGYSDIGSVRQSDRMASSRPSTGGRYESFGGGGNTPGQQPARDKNYTNADLGGARPSQQLRREIAGSGPTASQLPTNDRQQLREGRRQDGSRLNDDQKSELRKKYEDSGLTPGQLPSDGQGWSDADREDWQDWRNENREDWQKWYNNHYDDHWNYYRYSPWWYGYPVSTVSYSFYINDNPPCTNTVVVNQATGSKTYYYCSSTWYQPISSSTGSTKYVVTTPPSGAELTSLSNPRALTVNGREYYLSNFVFYQKIKRDGKDIYVTVDAPVGARVATIPEYAVEVKYQDWTYLRFGQTFYQKQGDGFVVVANPEL